MESYGKTDEPGLLDSGFLLAVAVMMSKGGGQLKRNRVVVFVGIETHPILVRGILRLHFKNCL